MVVVRSTWPADTVMDRVTTKIKARMHAFWSKAKGDTLAIEDVCSKRRLVVKLYVEVCRKCAYGASTLGEADWLIKGRTERCAAGIYMYSGRIEAIHSSSNFGHSAKKMIPSRIRFGRLRWARWKLEGYLSTPAACEWSGTPASRVACAQT
jgi:hypothetical protein